ncbi:MAG TPA: HNH endonuclease signature motif containing protein, partial [Euzebya sp.]|nr:HNH endonuclease signature motif containing protein [Euzebya sp.]
TPLPAVAQPPRTRAAQWAEALERMAAMALGGTTTDGTPRRARPRVSIIAPLSDLVDSDGTALGSVTARLLLRRGNGRRRISRALTRAIADDAELVAIFADDDGIPAAIGDCYAPITDAMRRAVAARDQGCRAPGCSTPIEHCDVHHVIPREEHGPTEVLNLVAMCRPCHTRITLRRWRMDLHPDGTLRTRIGRHTYVTRPRLPGTGQPGKDPDRRPAPSRSSNPPVARHTRRPDRSDQPVPF